MAIISETINGKMIDVIINSSNLKSASFNTENEDLTVTFNNGANFSNAFCFSHCFWLNGGACKPWPTMRSPGLALAGGSINSTFSLPLVSMTLAAHST